MLEWTNPPFAKWFVGGQDQHLATTVWTGIWPTRRENKAAIMFEGEPGDTRVLTYAELHGEVLQVRQCAEGAGSQDGRSRGDLHAA